MRRIRQTQMKTLDESARTDFHQRLSKFLWDELSVETAPLEDAALLKRIATSEYLVTKYNIPLAVASEGSVRLNANGSNPHTLR